jgi:hypothetical protein
VITRRAWGSPGIPSAWCAELSVCADGRCSEAPVSTPPRGPRWPFSLGAIALILAAIAWLWSLLARDGARGRRAEVSIEDRVNVVEAQRRLTRWAARLGVIGGACWASAVVLFHGLALGVTHVPFGLSPL